MKEALGAPSLVVCEYSERTGVPSSGTSAVWTMSYSDDTKMPNALENLLPKHCWTKGNSVSSRKETKTQIPFYIDLRELML